MTAAIKTNGVHHVNENSAHLRWDGRTYRVEIARVTPSMAKAWLCMNTKNRKLKKNLIWRYVRAIAGKAWKLNGDAICFSSDGRLLNGQHRLTAIVNSGMAVDSFVIHGIDGDAFDTYDRNGVRSSSDVIGMDGIEYSAAAAAGAAHYWRHMLFSPAQTGIAPEPTETRQLIADHPLLVDGAKVANRIKRLHPSVISYVYCRVAEKHGREVADEFFDLIATGADLSVGSPILLLINRMNDNAASKAKLQTHEMLALTVKAFNAWRAGTSLRYLRWQNKGDNAEPFPDIQ